MFIQYHLQPGFWRSAVEKLHAGEWIDRCSQRLREHWHTVEQAQLDDVAIDLWRDPRLRGLPPEDAAVEWLKQGVLASA
jgi:hypothetical protein